MDREPLPLSRGASAETRIFFGHSVLSVDAGTLAICLFRDFLFSVPRLVRKG